MNSDRRHELQQNELANYLATLNKKIEPYSKLILVGVGAVILISIGYALMQSRAVEQQSDATLTLIMQGQSRDAEAYGEIADKYPGTPAASWAVMFQADQYFADGVSSLYRNRETGEQLLGDAKSAYDKAIGLGGDNLLNSRAHFGLARVAESLGEVDDAIAQYKKCIAVDESDEMVAKAQSRIDELSKPINTEFLAWFKDFDPSSADPSLPPALPGMGSLPGDSTFSLPDLKFGSDASDQPADDDAAATGEAAMGEAATTENAESVKGPGGNFELPDQPKTPEVPQMPDPKLDLPEEPAPKSAKKPEAGDVKVVEPEAAPATDTPSTEASAAAETTAEPPKGGEEAK